MSKPDDMPAFPASSDTAIPYLGMSLRDWFAGQAVMQIVPNRKIGPDAEAIARYAYDIADAMLAQRNEGE